MFCFFSSRRRHTRCALVTGVQTCALPISFERLLVSPKITAGGRKQRDVAWPARSTGAGATIEDHLTANQPGAHLGDRVVFTVALLLGGGLAVLLGTVDVDGRNAKGLAAYGREGMVPRITGLALARQTTT